MVATAHSRAISAQPKNFGQFLLDRGVVKATQLMRANGEMAQADATLAEVLVALGILPAKDVLSLHAQWLDLTYVTAALQDVDPALLAPLNPHLCLRHSVVPLFQRDGITHVATSRPQSFDPLASGLSALSDQFEIVLASAGEIQNTLLAHFRSDLTDKAAMRVDEAESCRRWGVLETKRKVIFAALFAALATALIVAPGTSFIAAILWALLTLLLTTALKISALAASIPAPSPPAAAPAYAQKRPKVSILVPLFKEPEISQELLARLSRLTYPRSLLEVVLVLEETDTLTRNALAQTALPHWCHALVVPEGQPRTKPRAMNYALDFCRGDIIGIYDAEDLPDPDQIEKVVEQFRTAPPDLVCLQGALDYYNPDENWMARCFAIEYATWFRVILPGMIRMGLAIPLGGTTLFFRRDALETLGGWDAHNVTEDADLGIRLARHGYRTAMLNSTTQEEANCHPLPWIKQRSRWIKGYFVTYLVHMRAPRRLWRELGAVKFLGFQIHFVGALSQGLMAPLLWSFWAIPLGLPHPATTAVSLEVLQLVFGVFLAAEMLNIATGLYAVSGKAHRHLMPWVPTQHVYFMLNAFAAYKALFELITQPFYWDKTQHGHTLSSSRLTQRATARRIKLKPGHKCL